MQQRGCGISERLLGFVNVGALQLFEPRNLVHRQDGKELEKLGDVSVLDIAPVLPKFIRATLIGVEPDRALRGLTHLGA